MTVKSRTKQKNTDKKSAGSFSWNERAFHELADNIIDGVYCINTDGYFVFVNRAIVERSGITLEKLYGSHFLDVIQPEHHRLARENFECVMNGKDGTPYELSYKRPDGNLHVIEVHSRPIRDGGKVDGLMGIARNITDRKRVEETLRESEERFSVAFRVNPAPMTISTIDDGVVLDVNDRWLSMLGYARDEMIGQETAKLPIWLHYEARASFIRKFLKQGFLRGELVQLRTKSGEIRDTFWSAELIKYTGREVVLSLLYDVTDHKRAEEALREAHRRLDEIIEFLPDATFVIGADGKVITWNKAIEQMTGVSKAEMIGKGEYEYALPFYGERRPLLIDLALLDDPEFEKTKYDITKRAGDTIYAEAYVPETYGGKGAYLSGSASRLRDSAGNIVGAMESIRDATERKRAEDELAKYRKGLEQLVAERTQELEDKTKALEELNISLKVLLRHREEDKKELEDRFMSNVKRLILPYVEKMKSGALDPYQKSCLGTIESHLNEIISPFVRRMRDYNFTPKELTVASLIKDGKTTKEIAEILGVGTHAIDSHRNRIRKKTGLTARKSNLQSHLRSLE